MNLLSKKFLKRMAGFATAAALLLNLSACVPNDGQTEQQRFDAYLDTLPAEFISPQSLDVNYLFYRPADFGIEEALLELPYTDKQDWDEGMAATRDLLDELDGFNAAKLDESSQLTLSILQDYLRRQLLLEDFFYLDNSYLGSFIGFQAQLPLLLNEFHIENQHDLDSYCHILETCGEAFLNYAAIEKDRQAQNAGMSRSILDKVIEQCVAFADGDVTFLIESTNQKIDAAGFLSSDEKEAAKEKCAKLITEDLREAYRGLGDALSLIEAPDSALGLASQPNGQEYYEALLQQSTGVDMTVPEVKEYLENKYNELVARAQAAVFKLYRQQPDRIEQFLSGGAITFDYGDFSSADEVLEHLKEACKADYPPLPALRYEVKQVADSMKENFSPAAYLSSRIDAPEDSPEAIYLNGEFDPSLFTTLAHEGYPGHMYQHVYFRSLQLPAIRYLIDYNGYSEGWATYVEHNSIAYLPSDDQALVAFNDLYEQLTSVVIALSDIGIHYEGWNKTQYAEFMAQYFGELPAEMLDEQYALNLETPTNYLQYYLTGFLYQDLYNEAEAALEDSFSPVAFNRILLETGPAPFSIIQQRVYEWAQIEEDDASQKFSNAA